ncbi:MAG: c-type cytochrome biogenesis protein CcsB [Thiohalomonadaceae bacterium]
MSVTREELENEFDKPPFLKRLSPYDWVWAALVVIGTVYAYMYYREHMDIYEEVILFGTGISLLAFGWLWKPMRHFSLVVAVVSLFGISLYGTDLANAESSFFLKYLISSQSAIIWMSALFVMATLAYYFSLATGSAFSGKLGTALTWIATVMGAVGLMVRWRETHLSGVDMGYIPVSNLYEVFVLFAVMTAMMYLHYERSFKNRAMGAFVSTVITASVAFLMWYSYTRGAHEIQPLVPALQSWWMKIHVPANFIGYGGFSIAAMMGVAYLLSARWPQSLMARRLPSLEAMDEVMYRAIAIGFAFFTLATILGAMWAAEAWGGYWSWDPKETWALIVWLNYAAWLHLRLTKGWRGGVLAWWAVVGLFITLFAFLGVNIFLSGLHSYGTL